MTERLWWQSLRRRPLIPALLFALSVVAVMTSALGPLLVRAVHQSSLADAVAAAGPAGSSVAATTTLEQGDDVARAVAQVLGTLDGSSRGPGETVFSSPQVSTQSTSGVDWVVRGGQRRTVSRAVSGESGCADLSVSSGRCPVRNGEVLLGVADAERSGARIGSMIDFRLPSSTTRSLRVVGLYDPDRSSTLDLLRPASLEGQLAGVSSDPLIMSRNQLVALNQGVRITARLVLAGPLTVDGELAARETLERVQAATLAVGDRLVIFDSRHPQLLDDVDRRAASASILVLVTVVQAEALAVFALVIALQRLGRSRAAEWGVGRLRGMPTRTWLVAIWSEPAAALLLGLPVGLLAAVGVGQLVAGQLLRAGTPVEWWRWPVLVAAAAAVVVGLATLAAVTARNARRPLIEVLQQATDSRRVNPLGLVVQAVVVVAAAAALYQLLSSTVLTSQGSQLALLAPALFAFAVAVLMIRVAVAVVRRLTARPPRSLVGLVVGRHLARTPSTLSPAMVVAAGLALAVFSTQVWSLSVRNQELRAQAIVGADTVLHVGVPAGTDLVGAVRAADPTGRYAMAVQERAASSDGGTSRVVAVDSSRLEAVAPWLASSSEVHSLARQLHPATTRPVGLRGGQVEVSIADVKLRYAPADGYTSSPEPPVLSLIVQVGDAGRWQTVPLGSLRDRPASYRASLPCPRGCRLVGIDLFTGKGQTYDTTFTIDRLSTDQQPAATLTPRLREAQTWRERIGHTTGPDRAESATALPTSAGLTITASDTDGENHNRIVPTDSDDPLPALLAPGLAEQPFPGKPLVVTGTGLDGQSQLLLVVGRADILPRSLVDGVLVDLRNAQALSDPADDEATSEVWLTGAAPASVEQGLVGRGITVLGRERLSDTRDALLRQGNTRGAAVAVWLAMAGLLVSVLTLAGARAADASRRRADWSALRDAGFRPGTLRLLAFVEIAAPALLGGLVGIGSGLAALRLGAPRLPLVDVYEPGPPLDLHVSVGPVVILGVGMVVVIVVIAAVGAWSETRRRDAS